MSSQKGYALLLDEYHRINDAYEAVKLERSKKIDWTAWEGQPHNACHRYYQAYDTHEWHVLSEFLTQNINVLTTAITRHKNKVSKYFVTFTKDPSKGTPISEWKDAVEKQLSKKWFAHWVAVYEHEDTNIHCHALITPEHNLHKDHFKMFAQKYGYVDVKRVHNDNGITEYMQKENKIFKNLADE